MGYSIEPFIGSQRKIIVMKLQRSAKNSKIDLLFMQSLNIMDAMVT